MLNKVKITVKRYTKVFEVKLEIKAEFRINLAQSHKGSEVGLTYRAWQIV